MLVAQVPPALEGPGPSTAGVASPTLSEGLCCLPLSSVRRGSCAELQALLREHSRMHVCTE